MFGTNPNNRFPSPLLLLTAACLAAASRPCAASAASWWENPRYKGKGPARFLAALETVYQWDSNVRRRNSQFEQDHIGIISPEAGAGYFPSEKTFFTSTYRLDVERFARTTILNTLNHRWDARGRWDWGGGFLDASNLYLDTDDRNRTVFSDRIQRRENTWRAAFGLDLEPWTPELAYQDFRRRYEAAGFPAYDVRTLAPRLARMLGEDQQAFLEGRWERVDNHADPARDGDVVEGRIGWRFSSGERLSGALELGGQERDYRGADISGYTGFVGEVWARLAPTNRLAFSLGLAASAHEAPVEPPSAYYEEKAVSAGAEYQLLERLRLKLSQIYAHQKYGGISVRPGFTGQRRDDVLLSELSGTYQVLENLSVNAGLRQEQRLSNVDAESYHGHVVSIGCRVEL